MLKHKVRFIIFICMKGWLQVSEEIVLIRQDIQLSENKLQQVHCVARASPIVDADALS